MAWIEFYSIKHNESVKVCVPLDTVLYDETPHRPYRQRRARAARLLRRRLDLHPCTHIELHPHDWSDDIDPPVKRGSGEA